MLAFLRAELDVAEAVPVEVCTQEVRDLFRILVGHETEIDRGVRFGRDRVRRLCADVAGFDPAQIQSGQHQQFVERFSIPFG